jgi:hypothetical protein
MTKLRSESDARYAWRAVRIIARMLDRNHPFWWNKPYITDELFPQRTGTVYRCWELAIRNRKGE